MRDTITRRDVLEAIIIASIGTTASTGVSAAGHASKNEGERDEPTLNRFATLVSEGATPGDYVYIGLSELNESATDDEGDIRLERVDGGIVYRAELEQDYNISTLEPVIVGPDATDPADVANDALLNIDNVFVMEDGRVLCCEDADQFGRSYPNDCLYAYSPEKEEDDDHDEDEDDHK